MAGAVGGVLLVYAVLLLLLWGYARRHPETVAMKDALRLLPDLLRLLRRLLADKSLGAGVRIRLALLLAYLQWRVWRSDVLRRSPGQLCGEFLIGYAIMRAVGEIFREPDASLILGLSRGTFYSLFLVAAGIILIARKSPPLQPAPR